MAKADLDRVRRSADKVVQAREELLRAILKARDAGETHHAIADAAGLTRQRVQQIMREQGRT